MASVVDDNNKKMKSIIEAVGEIEPEPFANTYLNKENRTRLYDLDKKDPKKAKFQAQVRKSLLTFNRIMKKNAQGNKWKRKSNKMKPARKEALKRSLTSSNIDVNLFDDDVEKHEKKIQKTLDNAINNPAAKLSSDDKMNAIFNMVQDMNKKLKKLEKEPVEPIIGPQPPGKTWSKRFSDFIETDEFKIYFKVIEELSKLIFGNLTAAATGQETSWLPSLKKLGAAWAESILKSLWQILKKTLSVAYKLNMAGFSAIPFIGGGIGNSLKFIGEAIADAIILGTSIFWIMINLEIFFGIAALVSSLTGTTIFVSYMRSLIDNLSEMLYSLLCDAVLLPIRSICYMWSGGEPGSFKDLVINNEKNTRLWFFMQRLIDYLRGHAATFFNTLKKSSKELRLLLNGIQTGFGIIKFVIDWILGMMALAAENAKYAAAAAAEFTAEKLRVIAENLQNVPQLLSDGKEFVGSVLTGIRNKLPALPGFSNKMIGTSPNGYYDAMAVCSILGVSIVELKGMKNEPVVSYVLKNNSMTRLETFFVLCELSKEVEQKEVLLLEDKPKLKF